MKSVSEQFNSEPAIDSSSGSGHKTIPSCNPIKMVVTYSVNTAYVRMPLAGPVPMAQSG